MLKKSLLIFLSIFIFCSCDPSYSIQYELVNDSEHILKLDSDPFEYVPREFTINPNETIVIFEYIELGRNTITHLDLLESPEFDVLHLSTTDSLIYKKDPLDIMNWEKIYPESRGGLGIIRLVVNQNDF